MDFLPGALPLTAAGDPAVDPDLAADIVWFDALVTNIDRTYRNPNLLVWHDQPWLIDHGASFFRQYGATPLAETATAPTPMLPSTSCCRSPGRWPRPASASRKGRARASTAPSPSSRTSGSATRPARAARSSPRSCARDWPAPPTGSRRWSMPAEQRAFSYALLRVVPRVERGECMNVGVALLCRQHDFLGLRTAVDEQRLAALSPDLDPEAIRSRLAALDIVVCGHPEGGVLARLPISERFGWLVANSSTVIQPSQVHTGLTDDPAGTLDTSSRPRGHLALNTVQAHVTPTQHR